MEYSGGAARSMGSVMDMEGSAAAAAMAAIRIQEQGLRANDQLSGNSRAGRPCPCLQSPVDGGTGVPPVKIQAMQEADGEAETAASG